MSTDNKKDVEMKNDDAAAKKTVEEEKKEEVYDPFFGKIDKWNIANRI